MPPLGLGRLRVSLPLIDPEDQPGADTEELKAMAWEWGTRRGIEEPRWWATELRSGVARAAATFRIGDDFVALWLLSDGASLVEATYVCPWDRREADRAAREALVASLRLR